MASNPERPICRFFVNNKCRKGDKCRFYHPSPITPTIQKKTRRELGKCYCGAKLRTVVDNRYYSNIDEESRKPIFYNICSRTRRSIRRCM